MPIFRAYGIGDPSSYQGAHPSLGGVSDRANFNAKPCFCLSSFFWCFAMLIFTSFWEVGFFSKKTPPFPGGAQILQKNKNCANLLDFLANSQTSGDVGQTSGRRRARRARNVGQTSGKRRALGRAEGGGNWKKFTSNGTEVEKLKKRNLSCDAQNLGFRLPHTELKMVNLPKVHFQVPKVVILTLPQIGPKSLLKYQHGQFVTFSVMWKFIPKVAHVQIRFSKPDVMPIGKVVRTCCENMSLEHVHVISCS